MRKFDLCPLKINCKLFASNKALRDDKLTWNTIQVINIYYKKNIENIFLRCPLLFSSNFTDRKEESQLTFRSLHSARSLPRFERGAMQSQDQERGFGLRRLRRGLHGMRRQYAAAFKRTTLHAEEVARALRSHERGPRRRRWNERNGGGKFLAGTGGSGINFPRVVMLIDTSTRGSIVARYTKGCTWTNEKCPAAF